MKINLKTCNEEELWKYVGAHLSKNGFEAVLVGGAVVSIYSNGAYQSGDLDFIIQNLLKDKLPDVMKEIGFLKKGRHYCHPDCKHLFVEFPRGPLSLGDENDIKPKVVKEKGATFFILSPTDSIKDRLASYIYYKSEEGLDQAVLVAKAQPFKRTQIKKWCENENSVWAYEDFIRKLAK
jgi:hypothetical protein